MLSGEISEWFDESTGRDALVGEETPSCLCDGKGICHTSGNGNASGTGLRVLKRGLADIAVTSCLKRTSEKPKKVDGAESGAFSGTPSDPRLQALISHWASLPESLRESVFRQVCETLVLQKFSSNCERTHHDRKQ